MKLNKSRKPSQTRWHLMEPGGICKTRGRQREVEVNRAATVTGRSIDGTFWTSAERRRFTFRHVTDWWQGEANERTSSMERYRTNRSPVTGRTDRCTPAMIKKKEQNYPLNELFFFKENPMSSRSSSVRAGPCTVARWQIRITWHDLC